MVGQALADPKDVFATTAILLFFQTIGGAFMVTGAQAGFTNTLVRELGVYAPEVDPRGVIAAGATELRGRFGGEELAGVLGSYMEGLRVVFVVIVVLAGCAAGASVAMPWTSIERKQASP